LAGKRTCEHAVDLDVERERNASVIELKLTVCSYGSRPKDNEGSVTGSL
jgi:hypothetical protein